MFLLFKSAIFKIKRSFGRFLSVVLIVALGAGFFAGLREASPDMLKTVQQYYNDNLLMDYKITSTMGLTNDDIEELQKIENVDKVIPSYSVDVLIDGKAVRLNAIENDVNKITLKEGRLPKNNKECVGDANYFKIGDSPTFAKDKLSDYVDISSCKIVGLADSVLYLGQEKGIANIGNGKLESFIFIPKDNFTMEYYTEAYLLAKGTLETSPYTKEYENKIVLLNKELQELKPIQETKRYEEILEEATLEINKAQTELNEKLTKANEELSKNKRELDNSKQKIDNGYSKLTTSQNELNKKKSETEKTLENSSLQITNGLNQMQNELAKYGINENTLTQTLTSLKTELDKCTENCEALTEKYNGLQNISNQLNSLKEQAKKLNTEKTKFEKEIQNSQSKINQSRKTLDNNLKEVNEGYNKYNEAVKELGEKTKTAEEKIKTATEKLKTIEKPKWYLLDRTSNNGYTGFYEDASKVEAIAKVFPIFFIVVAVLMCLNTMTRLIEEERNEIGILTSLGYSNFKIVGGYIFYCLIATFFGVAIGLSVGYYLIPNVIYGIYDYDYILPALDISLKPVQFFMLLSYASILMVSVAIFVCMRELKEKPAILLRPKSPKSGKNVLLEKVNFIWKRFSFTWKVTMRNIFRYKKRVFMTIIGIAGCTALLLTGFGLRDGINGVINLQYDNILKYDALISLNKDVKEIPKGVSESLNDVKMTNPLLTSSEAYTFKAKDKNHDVYLIAPLDSDGFKRYVSLHSVVSDKDISLPSYGAVITSKMANLLGAEKGSTIKIRDSENNLYVLYVADIVQNYTMHYIYVSSSYLKEITNHDPNYNTIMVGMKNNNYDDISTKLLNNNEISAINYTNDNIETYDTIIKGMNKIVYLIIGASLLLALAVLYNLVIINVNERTREIATLKVLGFKDREVSSYVYREIIILTIIGIIIGLFLGVILHRYVMVTAETDNIVFLKNIKVWSFLFSFALTLISSIIVQLTTYWHMKKINMIESLKTLDQ